MSYTKTNWIDKKTALSAVNLNKMEQGIYDNSIAIGEIDVDGQVEKGIEKHNANSVAHQDIRSAITTNKNTASSLTSAIGNVSSLETSAKTLVPAINEVVDKIDDLDDNKASKSQAMIVRHSSTSVDANEIFQNGEYHFWNNAGMINFPPNSGKIGTLVVFEGRNFPFQFFSEYERRIWYRARGAGPSEWFSWQQIATTEKTEILPTPATDIKIIQNRTFKLNGITFFSLIIEKSDGTDFVTGTAYTLLQDLGLGFVNPFVGYGKASSGSAYSVQTNVYTNGVNLYGIVFSPCKTIMISGWGY